MSRLTTAAAELSEACGDLCQSAFHLRESINALEKAAGRSARLIDIMSKKSIIVTPQDLKKF